jgi:hypothetical protein
MCFFIEGYRTKIDYFFVVVALNKYTGECYSFYFFKNVDSSIRMMIFTCIWLSNIALQRYTLTWINSCRYYTNTVGNFERKNIMGQKMSDSNDEENELFNPLQAGEYQSVQIVPQANPVRMMRMMAPTNPGLRQRGREPNAQGRRQQMINPAGQVRRSSGKRPKKVGRHR